MPTESLSPENLIVRTAHVVREQIEDFASVMSPFDFDDQNLQGACGVASRVLARCYRRLGVECDFVMGWFKDPEPWDDETENHCWVEIPSRDLIVDVTATQFGIQSKVYITTPGWPYVPSVKNLKATRRLARWDGQSHINYHDRLIAIENETIKTVQNCLT